MLKIIIKKITPPIILDMLIKLRDSKYGFFGNFKSWSEAKSICSGYEDRVIFEKVKHAILKVKSGEAIYERDSVLLDKIEYSWPTLATLLYVAAINKGRLSVLDFGGSLGSSYYQNRKFFEGLNVEWSIVEQPHFVEFGIREIADKILRFYNSIEECLQDRKPNVILLSSVLQYLEYPYDLLDKICSLGISFIIIDRTPFWNRKSMITVQKVNPNIYNASYPCWVFNENEFKNQINGYSIYSEFLANDGFDQVGFKKFGFKGNVFKKKSIG